MEAAKLQAERLRAETEMVKEQSDQYVKQLQAEKEAALQNARNEALAIIESARRSANIAMEEIKTIRKQLAESAEVQGINQRQAAVRRSLNEAEESLMVQQAPIVRPAPPQALRRLQRQFA